MKIEINVSKEIGAWKAMHAISAFLQHQRAFCMSTKKWVALASLDGHFWDLWATDDQIWQKAEFFQKWKKTIYVRMNDIVDIANF